MRPRQETCLPDSALILRRGRRARWSPFLLLAIATAALAMPMPREASAQFGLGGFMNRGQGLRAPNAMRGPGPVGPGMQGGAMRGLAPQGANLGGATRIPQGSGLRGTATRDPGLQGPGGVSGYPGGRVPPGCRGPGCGRPGRPGVIIGVPPLVVPPYVGPSGPVEVVEDDLPPPRRAGGAGRKPPGGGQKAQQQPPRPPSGGRSVSGMPPAGEQRFVPDQIVAVLRAGVTDQQVDTFLRQNRLARTAGGDQQIALIGVRVFRFRILGGRSVRAVIPELARSPLVVSVQPEYLYGFAQVQEAAAAADPGKAATAPAAVPREEPPARDPTIERLQYVVGKLKLPQAHKVARGGQVVVAVIDSRIDATHPELAGAVMREIDVLDDKDGKPHSHGTAMAGAIVAKARLMGVAPEAQVIAVRAFSVTSAGAAAATSFGLVRGLDGAAAEGARIINLSLAGPPDPLLSRALKAARDKGIVLIAAAGNAGPRSAPLYPAADPNVIAVTATDADDKVYRGANRGKHIAVAAPGVDILVPAPQGAYEMSTGTSVAAAHVSGVVALLMARNPGLDPDAVRKVLTASARALGARGRDEDTGAGLADAYNALLTLDPKAAEPLPLAGAPTR